MKLHEDIWHFIKKKNEYHEKAKSIEKQHEVTNLLKKSKPLKDIKLITCKYTIIHKKKKLFNSNKKKA